MVEAASRACRRCNLTKPLEDFYAAPRGLYGRMATCIVCTKEKYRERVQREGEKVAATKRAWYEANREKVKIYVREWQSKNPERVAEHRKTSKERNPDRERLRARDRRAAGYGKDRETWREYERRYRAKYPEKSRQKNSRRRALEASVKAYEISLSDLRRIYSLPCASCGSVENLTMDHIIPLARGGTHGVGNLQSLCFSCNASKGSRLMVEWKHGRISA